jgi:hypothetical protein
MTGGAGATILSSSHSPASTKLPRLARSGCLRDSAGPTPLLATAGWGYRASPGFPETVTRSV